MGMWVVQYNLWQRVHYQHSFKFCQFGCINGYYTAHYQSPQHMLCMWEKLSQGKAECCTWEIQHILFLLLFILLHCYIIPQYIQKHSERIVIECSGWKALKKISPWATPLGIKKGGMLIDCLYTGLFLGLSWIESLLSYSHHHVSSCFYYIHNTIFFQKCCILTPKNNHCILNFGGKPELDWVIDYCYIFFKFLFYFILWFFEALRCI